MLRILNSKFCSNGRTGYTLTLEFLNISLVELGRQLLLSIRCLWFERNWKTFVGRDSFGLNFLLSILAVDPHVSFFILGCPSGKYCPRGSPGL